MKVHFLNCGSMRPRGAKYFAPPLAETPCNCLLIESADSLVLVDAGIGARDLEDPGRLGHGNILFHALREGQTAIRHVQRLGFRPEDVGHILCTHLDGDHTGGLSDFPNAHVHVLEAELEAASRPASFTERNRYPRCHFDHKPNWVTYQTLSEKSWFGMDCIRKLHGLPPEIILVPLPGHTRGHCGVSVMTEDGWLLHCGDAYYLRYELENGKRIPLSVRLFRRIAHVDYAKALQQLERIREAVRESSGEVKILASHDPGGVGCVQ